ncbi:MAG: ATP-dependent DNA ligase, partial [Patescibacteria group bacterium]
RLGVAEKTLLAARSWMEKEDKSWLGDLEKTYFVHPDVGKIITKFKEGSVEALSDLEMEIGIPVRLALCQREEKTEKIVKRMEGKAAAEYKLDGTRLQLHLDKGKEPRSVKDAQRREIDFFVATYTRNLEETTTMFPDIVQGVIEQLDVQSAILDGEVIGYDPETEEFLPFQVTAQRKRKYGVAEKAEDVPLKFFVFDLLYLDGENLLSKPLSERRALLESVIRKGEKIIPIEQKIVKSADQLANTFDDAVNKGLEGLVVKDLDACYQAGSRGYSWIKYKHQEGELSDTLDCVVLGYYAGQGKRAELGIGAFLVGVYKQERNRFETVAKIGTGLTDEQWEEMRRRCDDLTVEKQPANVFLQSDLYPDTWVRPEMVVEIFADEITQSPVHTAGAGETGAGYALRFPRLISWRDDKNAQDATTADEIIDLYEMQK